MKTVNIKEFLNSYKEVHAVVEGFCETALPVKPRYDISAELEKDIESEHHYYQPGRVLGAAVFLGACFGVGYGIISLVDMVLRMVYCGG